MDDGEDDGGDNGGGDDGGVCRFFFSICSCI